MQEFFRRALFGYSKEDVSNHIDGLMMDNRRIVKLKEDSIQALQKKLNDLELQVSRLKETENQFLSVQETLQKTVRESEAKSEKIDLLTFRVSSLQEQLEHRNEEEAQATQGQEALEIRNAELNAELLELQREKDELERKQVQSHVQYEELLIRYQKLQEREVEYRDRDARIAQLEQDLKEYHTNMQAISEKERQLENEKKVIGSAIIRAQEKASEMDRTFNQQYDKEREKLKRYLTELNTLRTQTLDVLGKFEGELGILTSQASEFSLENSDTESAFSAKQAMTADAPQIQLIKRG